MNDNGQTTTVLIVDPQFELYRPLVEEAQTYAQSLVFVHSASPEDAAKRLCKEAVDVVLMRLDLEEDAATDLVAVIESDRPGVPLIVATHRLDDQLVARACHLGAAGVLTYPYRIKPLLDALGQPVSDAGFSGTSCGLPTAQLLTLYCSAGSEGILHLRCEATNNRPERIGSIYLEAGQPVHATAEELVGSEAVHTMLGWADAEATWIPGQTRCARTIIGRWEGLLAQNTRYRNTESMEQLERMVTVAYPEVVEKLSRLAQTQDVLGAFLLRHAEVVAGRCTEAIDEQLASRALCRLAHVYFDIEGQAGEGTGHEIQAIVGSMRLVLDRIGPVSAGFQVGVLVRQAAPVCKSLRRLLRQVDAAFNRGMRGRGGSVNDRGHEDEDEDEAAVPRVA